jgi:hypothetical protein
VVQVGNGFRRVGFGYGTWGSVSCWLMGRVVFNWTWDCIILLFKAWTGTGIKREVRWNFKV